MEVGATPPTVRRLERPRRRSRRRISESLTRDWRRVYCNSRKLYATTSLISHIYASCRTGRAPAGPCVLLTCNMPRHLQLPSCRATDSGAARQLCCPESGAHAPHSPPCGSEPSSLSHESLRSISQACHAGSADDELPSSAPAMRTSRIPTGFCGSPLWWAEGPVGRTIPLMPAVSKPHMAL